MEENASAIMSRAIPRDQNLTPERRIKQRRDFLRIQERGNKVRAKHLLFSFIERSAGEDSRVGITVTTKVSKRAVRRNRFKRLIRELFRRNRRHFIKNVDLVVIALSGATELSTLQLTKEFRYLLYKAGILAERRKR